jgi:nitroimidazol reductase NimA-like FMN-containing flavoprotein (pyridoxamine 5'-phosphate oxidase superfamily)
MHKDLSVTDIDSLLESEVFGHLACADGEKPYIVPLAFVFYGNAIYGQTTEGKKIDILRRNPQVCFQVQKQTDRWQSVMCFGMFEELDFATLDETEASMIVELLTMRLGSIQGDVGVTVPFSFNGKPQTLTTDQKKSTLFRILITEKTGREFVRDS